METRLLNTVCDSLPKPFVTEIMKATDWACQESSVYVRGQIDIGRYGSPEAQFMLGYERRAVLETRLRHLAMLQGIDASVEMNDKENHQFTVLRSGRLKMTCSHSRGPDYFMLRSSIFRDDHASINAMLSQGTLDFIPQNERVDNGNFLNAIIYYKTRHDDKSKVEYLRLGFPTADNKKWAHKFDFYDILGNYSMESQNEEDVDLLIKWKSRVNISNESD